MDLPKELIDFRNWCQRNTIPKNFDTLDMLLMHYKKSIDCGQTETQAVRQNEYIGEDCEHLNQSMDNEGYMMCDDCGEEMY